MNNSEWKNYVANGYCFYKAAKQLGTVTFKNGQANLLNVAQSFVPATVNYAFAAELGLKAIIIKEKGDIKHIHELDKLLAELSYTACHFILSTVSNGLLITEDEVLMLVQTHAKAIEKAKAEYKKYQAKTLSPVEKAYLQTIKGLEKQAKSKVNKDK